MQMLKGPLRPPELETPEVGPRGWAVFSPLSWSLRCWLKSEDHGPRATTPPALRSVCFCWFDSDGVSDLLAASLPALCNYNLRTQELLTNVRRRASHPLSAEYDPGMG